MLKKKLLLLAPLAILIGVNQTFAWTLSMETLSGWQQVCKMDNVIISCDEFFWQWDDKIDEGVSGIGNTTSNSKCEVNGKEVPCEQALESMKWFFWWFAIVFLVLWLLWILLTILWVWMLIDVIKYQEKDKTMWILLIVFLWWLWAIIYYFVVRKERIKTDIK